MKAWKRVHEVLYCDISGQSRFWLWTLSSTSSFSPHSSCWIVSRQAAISQHPVQLPKCMSSVSVLHRRLQLIHFHGTAAGRGDGVFSDPKRPSTGLGLSLALSLAIHTYIHTYIYIYIYIYIYVYIYICMYICMRLNLHICAYVLAKSFYMYLHTHT